jgi:hypothetical protein
MSVVMSIRCTGWAKRCFQLILAGELVGVASFRACSPEDADTDRDAPGPDTAALLDGLSEAQKTELLHMQAHLLELTTGYRSGQVADALDGEPRPEYATSPDLGPACWSQGGRAGV